MLVPYTNKTLNLGYCSHYIHETESYLANLPKLSYSLCTSHLKPTNPIIDAPKMHQKEKLILQKKFSIIKREIYLFIIIIIVGLSS